MPYPVSYTYDDHGRRTSMTTYRSTSTDFTTPTWPTGATGDTTTWVYDPASGLLTDKLDAAGRGPSYTYEAAGRLKTRTWARGGNTTYTYDQNTGELLNVNYADPGTADVTYTYDELGRQKTVDDAVGTRTFVYDPATLQLTDEVIDGQGAFDGVYDLTIKRKYEGSVTGIAGRSGGLQLLQGGTTPYDVTYGYESTGRFNSVAWTVDPGTGVVSDQAGYTYVPNSDLLDSMFTTSGQTTTYGYEPNRDLKTLVRNEFDAGSGPVLVSQYDYAYDNLGRRTSVKNSGSAFAQAAFSKWGYDDRNQLTGADRYLGTVLSDTSNPVSNEARAYTYDPIGNRETALGQDGATTLTYTANSLNQYASIDEGGTVAVPVHDDDGNMTSDGAGRTLAYNGENRLVGFSDGSGTTASYVYDYLGRRVRKTVGGTTSTFVYDGWNQIREDADEGQGTVTTKHSVWGLDLSERMQGAGGIGGLVAVVGDAGTIGLLAFDGNGNVQQMLDGSTGQADAHYEYDAFGNVVVAVGAQAMVNPWRFSTKYVDVESGYSYYGTRYYEAPLGRWNRRDSIGEAGGENLYLFVDNASVNETDYLGQFTIREAAKNACGCAGDSVRSRVRCMELCFRNKRQQIFDEWYRMEQTLGPWWESLPKCPKTLCASGGKCVNPDPTKWRDPGPIKKPAVERFHPGAVYEMRGLPFGGHSNQCTYDKDHKVITTPPAMGTVDLVAPTISRFSLEGLVTALSDPGAVFNHWNNDVDTVIFAAQLDGKWSRALAGEPIFIGSATGTIHGSFAGRLTGLGPNMMKYFRVRPSWSEQ